MKLISLSANKASFHEIRFNPSGLSLILGKQANPDKSDTQKTYNGVGKSLAIALIHFCLGSSSNDDLKEKLPGWEFTLEFSIHDRTLISSRATLTQNKINLDGEDISVTKFQSRMAELLFELPAGINGLSFRPLIKRFIRPNKSSYLTYEKVDTKSTEYQNLIINSFLLGLDIDLVSTKQRLRSEAENIRQYKKHLKTDQIFKEFFIGDKNPDLELRDLEDEIERLEKDIEVFQVSENYYEIEKQANRTKRKLQELKNDAVALENAIRNIDVSLQVQPDIPVQKLLTIFEEAKARLPDSVVKSLEDVQEFQSKLIYTRTQRLLKEKNKLERKLDDKNQEISVNGKDLDTQIKYLGTYRALDEFIGLSHHLSNLKARAQKIYDYKELLDQYEIETQEINIKMNNENKRALEYLKINKEVNEKTFDIFRALAKRFYAEKPGGLTVHNNDGDNQIRFNIDARIQDDTSDGINEVKIFCFDMTNLIARHNHHISFLFHDSRLFSNMDPRQRAVLFKIAQEYAANNDAQYIASINEDQMLSVKDQFTAEEFDNIFTKNIVLELTDKEDKSKLLGLQVDLRYE